MPYTFTMPKLSPTMTEGTLVKWHKKEGDAIQIGDVLFEVATDKATVEVNALDPGYLRKVLISDGNDAKVNQPVAILSEGKDEDISSFQAAPTTPTKAEAPQEAAPEAASATPSAPAQEMAGKGGLSLAVFTPEPPLEGPLLLQALALEEPSLSASPLARRLAKENKLDLSTVKGSGPHGRILARDLQVAPTKGVVSFGAKDHPKVAPGTFEEEKTSPIRRVIGQRLQQSKMFIPHFYVTIEIDAAPLAAARQELKEGGVKITVNDFIVRGCALALRQHPEVNSGYHAEHNSIIRYKTIDVCVAVSVPGGLIAPIVRLADFKNLGQISLEVKRLASLAKEGKLQDHEYKGGSFTLSNLGMYGVASFLPIINPPQAANLGIGAIVDQPVVSQGKVVPGKRMSLTLAADHRVIDGALAAEFLVTLKKFLENPALLLVT